MKKSYLLGLAAIVFAACTQDNTFTVPAVTDPSSESSSAASRADIPALTQIEDQYYHPGVSICLDTEGYLCLMYSKGNYFKYDTNAPYGSYSLGLEYFDYLRLVRSTCIDTNDILYFITFDNSLIKVSNCWSTNRNCVDITSSFPSDAVFLSLTAADNGNVFVTTGDSSDGNYGATFPSHTVYRIASGGNVTEIATVNASVSATLVADWVGWEVVEWMLPPIPQIEYPSILLKANGSLLYGLSSNGNCYKITATTGAVEYFTPRVTVDLLAGSLNGNNPYALSGNTIVEIRPNLAKDIVIGTIPADIAANAYTLRVNADATAFFVGTIENGDVYKFTR